MQYFGEKIRALRLEKGLTQTQLADKIGLVKGSISAYEQGKNYNFKYNSCRKHLVT